MRVDLEAAWRWTRRASTLLAVLLGAGVAWGSLVQRVAAVEDEQQAVSARLERVDRRLERLYCEKYPDAADCRP